MTRTSIKLFLFLFLIICLPSQAFGQVVINEICWMGDAVSASHEWLELYNPSASSLDLTGWTLKTADEGLKVVLRGAISSQGFFILERSDDSVLANIKADILYQGALSNQGEKLRLLDNQNKIIDEVDFSQGWPAGDNKTKQTLQRFFSNSSSSGWCSSQTAGGTPKSANLCLTKMPLSLELTNPATTTESTSASQPPKTKPPKIASVKNVFINEFIPAPEGSDTENEWVEIYNANNFEIDISSWKIKDWVGAVKSYVFPKDTLIPDQGFLIITRPQNKITLQNDQDGLELLNTEGATVDSIKYQNAPAGQSYNRVQNSWQWSLALTPGKPNIIKTKSLANNNPTSTKATNATTTAKAANIAQSAPSLPKPPANRPISFLIGLGVAIISTIVVLTLHKKSSPGPSSSNSS